ncbi:MAG TPA: hypothetical protein VN851_18035 [Thermoanaerobaculia bacterium]|nr:hypothetical protein [Thermoanaerobaculia bacterium]
MTLPNHLQVRFRGDGISPARIAASELSQLVKKVEEYVTQRVSTCRPDLAKDEIIVSLNSVQDLSAGYGFVSSVPDAASEAFFVLGRAIEDQDFLGLGKSSRELVKTISSISRRHSCEADLTTPLANKDFKATITQDTKFGSSTRIESETSIFGYLERIGGAKPRFTLRVSEAETIHGEISEADAKALGPRLYSWVGLSGVAKWDPVSGETVDFKATSILPYKDSKLGDAISRLGESIGRYWDKEADVDRVLAAGRESQDL